MNQNFEKIRGYKILGEEITLMISFKLFIFIRLEVEVYMALGSVDMFGDVDPSAGGVHAVLTSHQHNKQGIFKYWLQFNISLLKGGGTNLSNFQPFRHPERFKICF